MWFWNWNLYRSISRLLMPSPGHGQRPWIWLYCRIAGSLSFMEKDVYILIHPYVEKWQKIRTYFFYVFLDICSTGGAVIKTSVQYGTHPQKMLTTVSLCCIVAYWLSIGKISISLFSFMQDWNSDPQRTAIKAESLTNLNKQMNELVHQSIVH